jgi:hypothetical protein
LAVNLTGYETATDLNLDFWAKYANSAGTLQVDFSGNGSTWQQVALLANTATAPRPNRQRTGIR